MVSEEYIRKKYEKFKIYWPNFSGWPDWSDIDFGFRPSKDAWGLVEWTDHGIRLSLDPLDQKYASLAVPHLFHEMAHIVCGDKVGHGKKFNAVLLEGLNNGGISEGIV